MPDQDYNSGGPARDAASILDSAKAAKSSLQDAASTLSKTAPEMKVLNNLTKVLDDTIKSVDQTIEKMGKRIGDFGSELRRVVSLSDDIEDSFKAIADYQRKMMREGMKAKDVKEYQKVLREVRDQTKELMDKGLFSKTHSKLVTQQIKEIESTLRSLARRKSEALDPREAEELAIQLERINKTTLTVAKNMKNVKLSHLGKELQGVERSLGHLLGPLGVKIGNRLENVHKYAQTGHEIRQARKTRDAGKLKEFAQQKAHILRRLPSLDIDTKKFSDPDKLRAERARRMDTIRSTVEGRSQERGLSPFATRLMTQAAMERAGGGSESFWTRSRMGLLAHSEGAEMTGPFAGARAMGRGLTSWGASAAEGGAGGLAALAGRIAPIIAVGSLIKDAFDKNQKMNADVSDKLGGGGIFTGKNAPITAMENVRSNLNSGGIYSRYGIGYDKNLALAQAMKEGGLSVGNLADGHVGNKNGFLQNSFGTMQANAYKYGKLAGLSPSETMTQTIKLITQYRQSLGATEDFFINIQKDTRAAGISTMKYIQIIDDVNSHYDRSNKLLMTTITIMSNLSKTGRDTAEDIKDAMDAVTNGGKQQPIERSAYANIQLLRDPQQRARMLGERQNIFNDASDSAAKALGLNEDEKKKFLDEVQQGGAGAISKYRLQADQKFAGDPTAHQTANGALTNLQQAQNQLGVTQRAVNLANKGKYSQAGLGLAAAAQNLGPDVVSNSNETMSLLQKALGLGGFHLSDMLDKDKAAEINSSTTFAKGKEQFGLDKQNSNVVQNLLEDYSASILDTLTKGISSEDQKDPKLKAAKESIYGQIYEQLGGEKTFGPASASDPKHIGAVSDYAKNNRDEMLKKLSGSQALVDNITGTADFQRINTTKTTDRDRKQQDERAAQLSAATRPTAEIFADAFTYLFNLLQKPLDVISRILSAHWGSDVKNTWATDDHKSMYMQFKSTGVLEDAMKSGQDYLDKLRTDYDNASPDQKAAANAKLTQGKADAARAGQIQETIAGGNGVLDEDMTWFLKYIQNFKPGAMEDAFSHPKSQQQISDWMKMVPSQTASASPGKLFVSGSDEKNWDGMLQALQKMGAIKMDKDPNDKTGGSYVITTTYNNVNFAQHGGGVPGVNKSGQTPSAPAAAGSNAATTKK